MTAFRTSRSNSVDHPRAIPRETVLGVFPFFEAALPNAVARRTRAGSAQLDRWRRRAAIAREVRDPKGRLWQWHLDRVASYKAHVHRHRGSSLRIADERFDRLINDNRDGCLRITDFDDRKGLTGLLRTNGGSLGGNDRSVGHRNGAAKLRYSATVRSARNEREIASAVTHHEIEPSRSFDRRHRSTAQYKIVMETSEGCAHHSVTAAFAVQLPIGREVYGVAGYPPISHRGIGAQTPPVLIQLGRLSRVGCIWLTTTVSSPARAVTTSVVGRGLRRTNEAAAPILAKLIRAVRVGFFMTS